MNNIQLHSIQLATLSKPQVFTQGDCSEQYALKYQSKYNHLQQALKVLLDNCQVKSRDIEFIKNAHVIERENQLNQPNDLDEQEVQATDSSQPTEHSVKYKILSIQDFIKKQQHFQTQKVIPLQQSLKLLINILLQEKDRLDAGNQIGSKQTETSNQYQNQSSHHNQLVYAIQLLASMQIFRICYVIKHGTHSSNKDQQQNTDDLINDIECDSEILEFQMDKQEGQESINLTNFSSIQQIQKVLTNLDEQIKYANLKYSQQDTLASNEQELVILNKQSSILKAYIQFQEQSTKTNDVFDTIDNQLVKQMVLPLVKDITFTQFQDKYGFLDNEDLIQNIQIVQVLVNLTTQMFTNSDYGLYKYQIWKSQYSVMNKQIHQITVNLLKLHLGQQNEQSKVNSKEISKQASELLDEDQTDLILNNQFQQPFQDEKQQFIKMSCQKQSLQHTFSSIDINSDLLRIVIEQKLLGDGDTLTLFQVVIDRITDIEDSKSNQLGQVAALLKQLIDSRFVDSDQSDLLDLYCIDQFKDILISLHQQVVSDFGLIKRVNNVASSLNQRLVTIKAAPIDKQFIQLFEEVKLIKLEFIRAEQEQASKYIDTVTIDSQAREEINQSISEFYKESIMRKQEYFLKYSSLSDCIDRFKDNICSDVSQLLGTNQQIDFKNILDNTLGVEGIGSLQEMIVHQRCPSQSVLHYYSHNLGRQIDHTKKLDQLEDEKGDFYIDNEMEWVNFDLAITHPTINQDDLVTRLIKNIKFKDQDFKLFTVSEDHQQYETIYMNGQKVHVIECQDTINPSFFKIKLLVMSEETRDSILEDNLQFKECLNKLANKLGQQLGQEQGGDQIVNQLKQLFGYIVNWLKLYLYNGSAFQTHEIKVIFVNFINQLVSSNQDKQNQDLDTYELLRLFCKYMVDFDDEQHLLTFKQINEGLIIQKDNGQESQQILQNIDEQYFYFIKLRYSDGTYVDQQQIKCRYFKMVEALYYEIKQLFY